MKKTLASIGIFGAAATAAILLFGNGEPVAAQGYQNLTQEEVNILTRLCETRKELVLSFLDKAKGQNTQAFDNHFGGAFKRANRLDAIKSEIAAAQEAGLTLSEIKAKLQDQVSAITAGGD